MHRFKATLHIVGINPFVFVPNKILNRLFMEAGKDKGPIPVCGTLNGASYRQTLVKFQGEWRLYINTTMLPDSPKRIGEWLQVTIEADTEERTIKPHPQWVQALQKNSKAKKVFDALPPSRKKEIVRYLANLKTEKSLATNVERAIGFLLGQNRFIGRDKP